MPVSEISAVDPSNFAVVSPGFDLESYLQQRNQDPNFVMVEFGHGPRPIAYRQPVEFTGQRAYIGVEAWLRNSKSLTRAALKTLQTEHPDQNIIYIDQDLSGSNKVMKRIFSSLIGKLGYPVLYNPATILSDEAADEVFLSNVFGDPDVAHSKTRTQSLLSEVSRLITEKGVVVIRETITPLKAQHSLTSTVLQDAGLQIAQSYTHTDQVWEHLEALYGAGKRYNTSTNFYQFMTKVAVS